MPPAPTCVPTPSSHLSTCHLPSLHPTAHPCAPVLYIHHVRPFIILAPHVTMYPCTPHLPSIPCTLVPPICPSHVPIMHVPCAPVTLPTPLIACIPCHYPCTPGYLHGSIIIDIVYDGGAIGRGAGRSSAPSLPIFAPTRVDVLAEDSACSGSYAR